MYQQNYYFNKNSDAEGIFVTPDRLYTKEAGYGFVTEKNRDENRDLQIPEINSGFDIWSWYKGRQLSQLTADEYGCHIDSAGKAVPLIFKADVPACGNYRVTLHINGGAEGIHDLTVFTQRRRLTKKEAQIAPGEDFTFSCNVNVTDIIPRGMLERVGCRSVDIAVLADISRLTGLTIEEADVPTIYIAGDSTVTDQTGSYPYNPFHCYSGWGQCFPAYINCKAAVSNHAHSGLTTESFRKEGHYAIVQEALKPGDYYFMQFAHNDQKLAHLTAAGGYRSNLIRYIDEVREKGAVPVIVTPLCRNTWKGSEGAYNDLLAEYAAECQKVGQEYGVPVLDLHKRSMDLITRLGLESAKRYFYPGDYTHTNDYGAWFMARCVAEECAAVQELSAFLSLSAPAWEPEGDVPPIAPPADADPLAGDPGPAVPEEFTHAADPKAPALRADMLNLVMKASGYFPANVYNDRFTDVVGHEWYAGVVECCWSNGIVDPALVDTCFYPGRQVTCEELLSYCVNAYKNRKTLPDAKAGNSAPEDGRLSAWARPYYEAASRIGLTVNGLMPSQKLTCGEAQPVLLSLYKALHI